MNKIQFWQYNDVEKVLDERKPMKELVSETGRTPAAITNVRKQAMLFQRNQGTSYISKSMKEYFKTYFTNRGNMMLEETQSEVASGRTEEGLEVMIEKTDQTFDILKQQLSDLAEAKVVETHSELVRELVELREYKKNTQSELEQLREFRQKAQKSNLGARLRDKLMPSHEEK